MKIKIAVLIKALRLLIALGAFDGILIPVSQVPVYLLDIFE